MHEQRAPDVLGSGIEEHIQESAVMIQAPLMQLEAHVLEGFVGEQHSGDQLKRSGEIGIVTQAPHHAVKLQIHGCRIGGFPLPGFHAVHQAGERRSGLGRHSRAGDGERFRFQNQADAVDHLRVFFRQPRDEHAFAFLAGEESGFLKLKEGFADGDTANSELAGNHTLVHSIAGLVFSGENGLTQALREVDFESGRSNGRHDSLSRKECGKNSGKPGEVDIAVVLYLVYIGY